MGPGFGTTGLEEPFGCSYPTISNFMIKNKEQQELARLCKAQHENSEGNEQYLLLANDNMFAASFSGAAWMML